MAACPLYRVPNVEVYAAGVYHDGPTTTADLLQTVRHFQLLRQRHLHIPPVGIGHEDDQAKLEAILARDPRLTPWLSGPTQADRTDLPAAGWVEHLRFSPDTQGGLLIADLVDVPEPIAELIEQRAYRKVSAETYTFTDDQGQRYPNTLRRVSLLGFAPPGVKRLKDLPAPVRQFAERRPPIRLVPRHRLQQGDAVICYSEVVMNKEQMLAELKTAGLALSEPALAALTDEDVQFLYNAMCVNKNSDRKKYAERDELIAKLVALGEDATQLQALSDADLAQLYASKTKSSGDEAMRQFSELTKQSQKLITELNTELTRIRTFSEEQAKNHKLTTVRTELADLVRSGRVTPGERDGMVQELLEASDEPSAIRKFSENGREFHETPFTSKLRRLKARPVVAGFVPKLDQDPNLNLGGSNTVDERKAVVRRFAEQNADALRAAGYTPDTKVKQFERLLEKNPDLTPEQFLKGQI